MDTKVMTPCNWCLREGVPVQRIEEKLWRFWGTISEENPMMESLRNICEECRSRYETFSTYIERCKSNEAVIETIQTSGGVKREPPVEVIKEEEAPEASNLAGPSRLLDDPDVALQCSYCDRLFCTAAGLRRHLATVHTGERQWPCLCCDERFFTYPQLKRHLLVHIGSAPFACSRCDERFPTAADLKTHAAVHSTDDESPKCPKCDRRFETESDLTDHLLVHTGEKPFRCVRCDKSFPTWQCLRNHSHVHAGGGERPFRCDVCPKKFSTAADLRRHSPIHSRNRPFGCPHCDRTFAQSTNLNAHLHLLHTRTRSHRCSGCSKSFTSQSSFKRHQCLKPNLGS